MIIFNLVDLLFDGNFISLEQCDNLTLKQMEYYHAQWSLCNTSLCPNSRLHYYLKYLQASSIFKIYISIENYTDEIYYLINFDNYSYENKFHLVNINFDSKSEEFLFNYFFQINLPFLYATIALYILCLILFVKNMFFILTILLHIFITIICTFIIYAYLFNFPMLILNYTSVTLYLFIILIDSFLWYVCWFTNSHRRDDCTINRIIEDLLTQTLYYLVPKNLAAITVLVITCISHISAIQYFAIFSCLLLFISIFVSFILYPGMFMFDY